MSPPTLAPVAQSLSPASPEVILGVLVVLGIIVLVGRLLLKVAWRLVVIGIVIVGTVYVLSLLGFSLGLF